MTNLTNVIESIRNSVSSKDKLSFDSNVEVVANILGELDSFSRNEIVKVITTRFKSGKGRLSSPFTEEKLTISNGKRGRPQLSNDQKIASQKAKLEAKLAKLN